MTERVVECCPNCGANMYKYWHRLNKQMCQSLVVLYEAGGEANIAQIGLTHNQVCNFQKLKYWGLVVGLGAGLWKVTRKGRQFCDNRFEVPARVQTFRGSVVNEGGALVKISDIVNGRWAVREDYAREASNG